MYNAQLKNSKYTPAQENNVVLYFFNRFVESVLAAFQTHHCDPDLCLAIRFNFNIFKIIL